MHFISLFTEKTAKKVAEHQIKTEEVVFTSPFCRKITKG